jgi:hypothetical protein
MMQPFKTKLAKITKLHYDDLWVTPCWLYLVAIAPAGALLGLAILQPWVPVSRLLKDPSTITGTHPFVGLVSNIGIVLWCMTAAICLYAGALAFTQRRTAGDVSFLIAAGLLTGLLAFDDLFLFHEWIGPRLLALNEEAILACYGILAAAYIVAFRRQIMRHGLLLFAAKCGIRGDERAGGSVTRYCDRLRGHDHRRDRRWSEVHRHRTLGGFSHFRCLDNE